MMQLIQGYVALARDNSRFVAFGVLMTFSSSFGQTYFIGIFGPQFQAEFGLTHTGWGSIYLMGTLASAFLLPLTGKLVDRVDLRKYTLVVGLGLAFACWLTALAWDPIVLVFAVLALRQTGQGLSSHIAQTSMARYFEGQRGRAIAVSTFGYASAEALLPVVAVLAIGWLGWRAAYATAGVVHVAVLLPALLWLLRGHGVRHAAYLQRIASRSDSTTGRAESGWTRADVLKDKTFYFLLPGVMATSLVLTAMFFHHLNIAAAKGWSGEWITGNYVVYSTMTVATSLLCGPVIDRIGALRIVRVMLFPAIVGLGLLASFDTKFVVWPYMALIGVTTGVTYTAVAAMWAELYGVAHLGAIRSVATSVGIFGSALGPVIMGAGFDFGASVAMVSWCFAAYMIAASLLLWVATRPRSEKPA